MQESGYNTDFLSILFCVMFTVYRKHEDTDLSAVMFLTYALATEALKSHRLWLDVFFGVFVYIKALDFLFFTVLRPSHGGNQHAHPLARWDFSGQPALFTYGLI